MFRPFYLVTFCLIGVVLGSQIDCHLNQTDSSNQNVILERSPQHSEDETVYIKFLKTIRWRLCIVSGIIRRQGHSYILCMHYPPHSIMSIRVYEETPPFDLLMLKSLEEANPSRHYASDAAGKCIYMLDQVLPCIWKFTTEDHQVTKWLCHRVQPISLTVSTDGQVVVFRQDETSSKLEIYGPNGVFIRRIALSNNIGLIVNVRPSLHDTLIIVSKHDTFIIVSLLRVVNFDGCPCAKISFNLVSGSAVNAPTTNGQIIISQVNHTLCMQVYSNQTDSYWCWKVIGSTLELNIDLIYSYSDRHYLFVGEHMIPTYM